MSDATDIEKLLNLLANPTVCRSSACGKQIWFVITKSGKSLPVEADGTPHFATCPDAKGFRK